MVRDRSERSIGQASIDPQSTSEGTMVRFGCIVGAHGLRGALRLRPDNPESGALANIKKIAIDLRGQRSSFRVGKVDRIGHGILRIELDGVIEANAAEALKSGIVMIARSDLPEIGPAEFYYFEAIGCAVFLTDGRRIGTVEEVIATGANEVIVVRGEHGEILVPAIDAVIKSIDLESRRMVIEAVPGLLDAGD